MARSPAAPSWLTGLRWRRAPARAAIRPLGRPWDPPLHVAREPASTSHWGGSPASLLPAGKGPSSAALAAHHRHRGRTALRLRVRVGLASLSFFILFFENLKFNTCVWAIHMSMKMPKTVRQHWVYMSFWIKEKRG